MTRSTTSSSSVHADALRSRHIDGPRNGTQRSAIDDLTAATQTQQDYRSNGHSRRMVPGIAFSVIIAIAAGAVLLFSGQWQYRCTALMQLVQPTTGLSLDRSISSNSESLRIPLRTQIAEYIETIDPPIYAAFSVEAPAADLLRLNLFTSNRTQGLEDARSIAESFITITKSNGLQPTAREQWLRSRLDDLTQRLDSAEQTVIETISKTSHDDPVARHGNLLERWTGVRSEFERTLNQLRNANANLNELKQMPVPTRAPIPAQERQKIIDAHEPLQQDIAQLKAEMADLRSATLETWQTTSPMVDELVTDIENMLNVTARALDHTTDDTLQTELERIVIDAESFQERVATFSDLWTRRFLSLKTLDLQPMSNDMFDTLDTVNTAQSDFLYHAGKALTSLKTRTRNLSNGSGDSRIHVLESDVVRAFESLRQRHDRLSLTLSGRPSIATDAATRTCRRLDRRVRDAIAQIDQLLAIKSLDRAKVQHQLDIDEADSVMTQLQQSHDAVITRLIELQDELNITNGLTAEFLRDSVHSEYASMHLQDVVREVDKTQRELGALEVTRTSQSSNQQLRLRQVVTGKTPHNLTDRLKLAAIAAAVAFIISILSQWYLIRKRDIVGNVL